MPRKNKSLPAERLEKELVTKKVYHFVDSDRGIDQICREVFKKKDEEVHYPIGYDGGPKYKHAKRFIYRGFKGQLPVGVQKAPTRGLGFTKILKPLMGYIEAYLRVEEVIVLKTGRPALSGKCLTLTESSLRQLHTVFKNAFDKHKNENERLAAEQMHLLLPKEIKKPKNKYIKNSIASALSTWQQALSEFSDKDKDAVRDLFDKLSLTDGFLKSDALLKTKSKIDEYYIEDVIAQFKKLMRQKNETKRLEKQWQSLLKKHSWLFSYLFAFPIILLQDEAYVGGKNLSNKDGKVTDFIVKNDLTNNVAFVEIKTHKTKLIKKGAAYRGTDVYAMSSDLSGAISQVLNQRDIFQKEFANHKLKSKEQFETFNSKCVVLMGSLNDLKAEQLSSFELFRSNSRDVEIITFDELLTRFTKLRELITKGGTNKKI